MILDSVQFTKNDWRNRNKLRQNDRDIWLTIPIKTAGRFGQRIDEAEVTNHLWASSHWKTIQQILGKRTYFEMWAEEWDQAFKTCLHLEKLAEINELWLRLLMGQLNLSTTVVRDTFLGFTSSKPNSRLIEICHLLDADEYVFGPASLNYLDVDEFARNKIRLEVIDYSEYAEYRQGKGSFSHFVSVLDLMVNLGLGARNELRNLTKQAN